MGLGWGNLRDRWPCAHTKFSIHTAGRVYIHRDTWLRALSEDIRH